MNDFQHKLFLQKLYGKAAVEKKPTYIRKKSLKRVEEEKKQRELGTKPVGKLELDKWFFEIEQRHCYNGAAVCMECGAAIHQRFMRHATAHLLPKKLFKSVATHPFNYLILGATCGCHQKTDRIDKFVMMKVWDEATRRIKMMIPLLPFDELKYLSSQLMTALDNTP